MKTTHKKAYLDLKDVAELIEDYVYDEGPSSLRGDEYPYFQNMDEREVENALEEYNESAERAVLMWTYRNLRSINTNHKIFRGARGVKEIASRLYNNTAIGRLLFMKEAKGHRINESKLTQYFIGDDSRGALKVVKSLLDFITKKVHSEAIDGLSSAIFSFGVDVVDRANNRDDDYDDDYDDNDLAFDLLREERNGMRWASKKAHLSSQILNRLVERAVESSGGTRDVDSKKWRAVRQANDRYASRNFRSRQAADQSLVDMILSGEGKGADLSGADLKDANLRGADLKDANLRGANLRGANLFGAEIRRADLRGASLTDAYLERAKLSGANLEKANLRGADLEEANLWNANLRGADLKGADLAYAYIYDADLRGADLSDANLTGADLRGTDLEGAYLKNVKYNSRTAWPRGFWPRGFTSPGEDRMASRRSRSRY